ncbi:DMT family transporter [Desulfosporosinus sp. FKA]|uniref:DMT family transporter n=1 Tax=Desulfosporosinus sp. FKA TaxID=1969834 RepID=UPI000B4A53CE|nr:DMT family transporter [Desulfosporosinus sp. FKA]
MNNVRGKGHGGGIAAIIISALGFAFYPIFGKFVFAGGANLATVLFVRFFIGAIAFWSLVILGKSMKHLTKRDFFRLWLLGGVVYAGQAGLYISAVKFIPSSMASLIFYVYPVLVTILALATKQERLSITKVSGLLFSILGLILVLGVSFEGLNLLGIFCSLGAAAIYSIYILTSNRIINSVSPLLSSAVITSAACVTYGITGLIQGFTWNIAAITWMDILGIAILSTIIAILTFFWGLQKVGPTTASIVSTLEPVLTVGLAYIFLGEYLNFTQNIGAACVLLGAVLAAWPHKIMTISVKEAKL